MILSTCLIVAVLQASLQYAVGINMIKLIASDLDGTLLQNGAQELNPGTVQLIHELTKQGRIFVAASGRQYPNLKRLFAPVSDEIAFICENGSLVVYQDKILAKHIIPRTTGQEILNAMMEREGCEALLSGVNTCYIQPKDEAYMIHIRDVVKNTVTVVDDILKVEEPYLKISVYEKNGINNSEDYWNERFGKEVTVVTSGNLWLDTVPKVSIKEQRCRICSVNFRLHHRRQWHLGIIIMMWKCFKMFPIVLLWTMPSRGFWTSAIFIQIR